jgi:hypothetical protein
MKRFFSSLRPLSKTIEWYKINRFLKIDYLCSSILNNDFLLYFCKN